MKGKSAACIQRVPELALILYSKPSSAMNESPSRVATVLRLYIRMRYEWDEEKNRLKGSTASHSR